MFSSKQCIYPSIFIFSESNSPTHCDNHMDLVAILWFFIQTTDIKSKMANYNQDLIESFRSQSIYWVFNPWSLSFHQRFNVPFLLQHSIQAFQSFDVQLTHYVFHIYFREYFYRYYYHSWPVSNGVMNLFDQLQNISNNSKSNEI